MSAAARTVCLFLAIICLQIAALRFMGHPWMCRCGQLALWYGATDGAQTSQQLADWYSLTHVEHGLIFCLVLVWAWPHVALRRLLLAALAIEVAWEIVENTPLVIDRYRQGGLAAGYFGDSVLNSLGDVVAMALGFVGAWFIARRWTMLIIVLIECLLLLVIRDNLVLNIVQILHPMPALSAWQTGG